MIIYALNKAIALMHPYQKVVKPFLLLLRVKAKLLCKLVSEDKK
jgi:hypothetical protein